MISGLISDTLDTLTLESERMQTSAEYIPAKLAASALCSKYEDQMDARRLLWITFTIAYLHVEKTGPCNVKKCGFINNLISTPYGTGKVHKAPEEPQASFGRILVPKTPHRPANNGGLVTRPTNRWPYKAIKFKHPIQSPVDIITSRAVTLDLPRLTIGRSVLKGSKALLKNAGHTAYIYVVGGEIHKPFLTGGPLKNKYVFEQLHFHWGKRDLWGSEHFVDGESFSLEIHAVYFNKKYPNFNTAYTNEDGLAVLTVFAKIVGQDNILLEPLHKLLGNVTYAQSSVLLDSGEALQWAASALSLNTEYYAYPGSLTTKPFSENVIFIILPKPITLSLKQLQAFRRLRDQSGMFIWDNKRQLQPLYQRPIVRSTNFG